MSTLVPRRRTNARNVAPSRIPVSRLPLLAVIVALAVVATPASAAAQSDQGGRKNQIVITGRVDVSPGERTGSVVILDGPAVIRGDVKGSVVVLRGSVRVSGRVSDHVVAVRGQAFIERGARVGGDVVSRRRPVVAPGATVEGKVRRENIANYFRALGWFLWFAWWLAVSVSVLVLGLLLLWLAPRVASAAIDVARSRIGAAVGWGLAMTVGLPILSILLLFTLVGIPLGLIGLLSLALLYGLGYALSALVLGRALIKDPRRAALPFCVGLLILRVIDLIPVLGNLVTFAATVFGVGALTVAGWRAARGSRAVATEPLSAGGIAPQVAP